MVVGKDIVDKKGKFRFGLVVSVGEYKLLFLLRWKGYNWIKLKLSNFDYLEGGYKWRICINFF